MPDQLRGIVEVLVTHAALDRIEAQHCGDVGQIRLLFTGRRIGPISQEIGHGSGGAPQQGTGAGAVCHGLRYIRHRTLCMCSSCPCWVRATRARSDRGSPARDGAGLPAATRDIDPPASPKPIMRGPLRPYHAEKHGPGEDNRGELGWVACCIYMVNEWILSAQRTQSVLMAGSCMR